MKNVSSTRRKYNRLKCFFLIDWVNYQFITDKYFVISQECNEFDDRLKQRSRRNKNRLDFCFHCQWQKSNSKCDKLTDINKLKEDFQHLKGSLVKNTVFQNTYVEYFVCRIFCNTKYYISIYSKMMSKHIIKCLVQRLFWY